MNAARQGRTPGQPFMDMPEEEPDDDIVEQPAATLPEVSFTAIDLDRDDEEGQAKTGAGVIQALVKRPASTA
jgi:hypothetical protein